MSLTDRIAAAAARLTGMNTFPCVSGPRVRLRPPQIEDLEPIFRLFSDTRVVRYWSRPAMRTRAEAEAYVASILEGFVQREFINWIVAEPGSERMLGTCTLYDIQLRHLRCGVGYAVLPDEQGRGIASAAVAQAVRWAFEVLDLVRVEADIHPENTASGRVLMNNGFRAEALLRQRFIHNDELQDSQIYALLASEWQARPAADAS